MSNANVFFVVAFFPLVVVLLVFGGFSMNVNFPLHLAIVKLGPTIDYWLFTFNWCEKQFQKDLQIWGLVQVEIDSQQHTPLFSVYSLIHSLPSEKGSFSYMTLPRLSCVAWPGFFWVCHLSKQLADDETKTRSLVVRCAHVSCVTRCLYLPDIETLVHILEWHEIMTYLRSNQKELLKTSKILTLIWESQRSVKDSKYV